MFECMELMMIELCKYIVPIIGIYLIFDFTGSILFGKR